MAVKDESHEIFINNVLNRIRTYIRKPVILYWRDFMCKVYRNSVMMLIVIKTTPAG